jgi:DNA polymerase-3 subunit beta
MKITINRKTLINELKKHKALVAKKQTMPVLECIRLTSDIVQLTLESCDLEVSLQTKIKCNCDSNFDRAINFRQLSEACKSSKMEFISLEYIEGSIVRFSDSIININLESLDGLEYPIIPLPIDAIKIADVYGDCFKLAVNTVKHASSHDDTRYNLNGIYLETNKNLDKIILTATDGHRLCNTQVKTSLQSQTTKLDKGIIIPNKAIEIVNFLDDANFVFYHKDNVLMICAGGTTLTIRLIVGEYPDYKLILPKTNGDKILIINSKDVLPSLKQLASIPNIQDTDKKSPKLLKLSLNGKILATRLESTIELKGTYEGQELIAGYNISYLIDVLEALPEVKIYFTNELSPMFIHNSNDCNDIALVMPTRI